LINQTKTHPTSLNYDQSPLFYIFAKGLQIYLKAELANNFHNLHAGK